MPRRIIIIIKNIKHASSHRSNIKNKKKKKKKKRGTVQVGVQVKATTTTALSRPQQSWRCRAEYSKNIKNKKNASSHRIQQCAACR